MSTVIKENLYIKYIGQPEEFLTQNKIYAVENINVQTGYFGLGWPRMFVEFHADNDGLFDREVGDENFVVVQEGFWVEQELGRYLDAGDIIEYKGSKFPFFDYPTTAIIMKLRNTIERTS